MPEYWCSPLESVLWSVVPQNILDHTTIATLNAERFTMAFAHGNPRETLENRSANCIDGTVLMASVLEAASLNPAIVLVPGHAFLAWESQAGNDSWDYLETTLIGSREFEEAQKVGRSRAEQYRAKSQPLKNRMMFRLLSIPALRVGAGILPME